MVLVVKNRAGDMRGKFDLWSLEDPLEGKMVT